MSLKYTCPHCGGHMVDMLVLDGRDERLRAFATIRITDRN